MEYVYFVTPQPRPNASRDDTMLAERSVADRFADVAASVRAALPEGSAAVTITHVPGFPRVGKLVISTSVDKSALEEALSTALLDSIDDPTKR